MYRILIIEDDLMIAKMLAAHLEKWVGQPGLHRETLSRKTNKQTLKVVHSRYLSM